MDERIEATCEQIAVSLNIPKEDAYCLVQFGEKRGWIKKLGNMPTANKRGRGATIYAVPVNFADRIAQIWETRKPIE